MLDVHFNLNRTAILAILQGVGGQLFELLLSLGDHPRVRLLGSLVNRCLVLYQISIRVNVGKLRQVGQYQDLQRSRAAARVGYKNASYVGAQKQ